MKTIIGLLITIPLALTSHADLFGTGTNQFSMDFVRIGHAGNATDNTGYGAVGYNYRMGTYEVTIDQFSKAVAADSRISHGLVREDWWNYHERTVGINAPAVGVSWTEAAMFVNWLTSGDAYSGAYQFDGVGTYLTLDRESAIADYGRFM